MEAAFNKFDKSGNGKLNYMEFCGMMNARKKNSGGEPNSSGASTPASTPTAASKR